MSEDFDRRLRVNRVAIVGPLEVGDTIMAYLYGEKMLTDEHYDDLNEMAKHKRKKLLLDIIKTRGPDAEWAFLVGLAHSEQSHVIDYVRAGAENRIPAHIQAQIEFIKRTGRKPPSLDQWPPIQASAPPRPSAPPSSNLDNARGSNIVPDAIADVPYMEIKFKNASITEIQKVIQNTSNLYYSIRRNPRGRAIILNIINYDNPESERTGADVDERNMKSMLQQLYFEVEVWRDVKTKKDLEDKLKVERKRDHSESDAFVFVIMAHGEEERIYLGDKTLFKIKSIINAFSITLCPTLKAPKIFFIQACQGGDDTVGTEADAQLGVQSDAAPIEKSEIFEKVHEQKDIYVAYATTPGLKSYRDKQFGSWFIRSVVETFRDHAHEMDLKHLMTMVANKVDKKRDHLGYLQCCRNIDQMPKLLYFLPGFEEPH